MRVLLLIVLLAGALGFARYSAHQRYPTESIKVPGSTRTYKIARAPDQCRGADCFMAVAFMTQGTDRATWRAEAQELEPWLIAQARTKGQRGAFVVALRPGFAHLFPPTHARYFVFGGGGARWKIIKEGDADTSTLGMQ